MNLLKSKTFYSGVAGIITGIGLIASGDMATGVITVLLSLQNIFQKSGIIKMEEILNKAQVQVKNFEDIDKDIIK